MYPIFFFFNDTATTEIYTLSLHDALPIYLDSEISRRHRCQSSCGRQSGGRSAARASAAAALARSEEHTSELQSQSNIVCRLLLEKKKQKNTTQPLHRYTEPRSTLATLPAR